MYFRDLLDRLDSFHADFDLFQILCCEPELALEQQRRRVLESTSQHNKLNDIFIDQQVLEIIFERLSPQPTQSQNLSTSTLVLSLDPLFSAYFTNF